MRVGVIICGDLETVSGSHMYNRQLVEYLRRCGDSVDLFSLPERSYVGRLAENVVDRLQPRLAAAQLDVLLQDEANYPALLRLNRGLRRHAAYPIVTLVHRVHSSETYSSGLHKFYRRLERQYLKNVDGFISSSETTQRALGELLDPGNLGRSVVAHSAGDRFNVALTPEEIRRRAVRSGTLRLVFVGDFIRRKGLLILLEALLKLPPGTCQLTVVGNPDIDALYLRVVYHLLMVTQLTGVTLAGVVSDAELAAILGQGDVLVVPAEYAGSGTVYLEGMGFGLPAIGTNSGVASEIIADGVNGYLVPPNDPAALANCLQSLASDRGKLTQLSLAARERFLAQPAWLDSMDQVRQALLNWTGQSPVNPV